MATRVKQCPGLEVECPWSSTGSVKVAPGVNNGSLEWCWSAIGAIGGVLEWHWMGYIGYWCETDSLDWCWNAVGVIRGVLELHWICDSGY
jgi:hypothetical protein